METKSLSIDFVKAKFDENKPGVFEGYASVFGGVDSYGDTIVPGAYADTIKNRERPIQLRWNHWGPVIGKWLEITEDEYGLYVKGELTPGHTVANDTYALLKHGAVTGMSIGYRVKEMVEYPQEGRRELKQIELIEISIVESPADNSAHVSGVKSAISEAETLKEIESILRDAGRFSRSDATAIVSRVKHITHGEREEKGSNQQLEILKQIETLTMRLKNGNH